MKTEKDILDLIENDSFMMEILEIVATIDLEDYWVCAGFIRNKVWDTLYNCSTRTPYNDIDIVYFNSTDLNENHEKFIEEELYRNILIFLGK